MALSDYVNRRYDYLALRNTTGPGERKLGLELFNADTSGQITAGVQKLAQRWLLEFLTERGSIPGLPNRGSGFMKAARIGGFRTQINVQTEFALADMNITRNLRAEEPADMPDDEKFGSAVITNIGILPGYAVSDTSGTTAVFLTLGVKITSLAGNNADIVFPIEILPRE
jgi:hypothetical protein